MSAEPVDTTPHVVTLDPLTDEALFDGEPLELLLRSRALRGMVAYYPMGMKVSVLESLMSEQDTAFTNRNQVTTMSFSFRREGKERDGVFRVICGSAWGIEARDGATLLAELQAMSGAVEAEGWDWARAASSLAGRLCRNELRDTMTQLPPRWRALAHDSIHQGPALCIGGGFEDATCWDRRAAFLTGMAAPVPLPGTWTAVAPERSVSGAWARLRRMDGLIRATVRVPTDAYTGRVPPLPVRMSTGTIYPVGIVRWAWSIQLLRDAIENGGCELIAIHEAAICHAEPLHEPIAERLDRVQDRILKKILYTRYWGMLASLGGWEGTINEPDDESEACRFNGSELYWKWTGHTPTSRTCGPTYRPDHAAFIASDNHVSMAKALRTFEPYHVAACHIDAIWSKAGHAPPGRDFRAKVVGPLRFYGTGTYEHHGECHAQGREGTLKSTELAEWAAKAMQAEAGNRAWHGRILPRDSADAKSDPIVWTDAENVAIQQPGKASIYDVCFTPNGWIKEEKDQGGQANDAAENGA